MILHTNRRDQLQVGQGQVHPAQSLPDARPCHAPVGLKWVVGKGLGEVGQRLVPPGQPLQCLRPPGTHLRHFTGGQNVVKVPQGGFIAATGQVDPAPKVHQQRVLEGELQAFLQPRRGFVKLVFMNQHQHLGANGSAPGLIPARPGSAGNGSAGCQCGHRPCAGRPTAF